MKRLKQLEGDGLQNGPKENMGTRMLGKISRLNVREAFKDEARDFTPWLAKEENLQLLSEEIGVEIKLVQVEANVGRYSVDILAEEEGTGRKIIIENQFSSTDHDHLGKLITYASGHDAKVVIWIFEELRDEHRQAIEWLNENTNAELDFFAVNLQLWKIDASNPAPKFDISVSPNEWTKTIRNRGSDELSDTKLQQLEFWTQLKTFAAKEFPQLRLQTPQAKHWTNIALGSSHAHLSLTVNTNKEQLACEVYIQNDKDLFQWLKTKDSEIESRLKMPLEWIEASKASRIKNSREEFSIGDATKYTEYFQWLLKSTIAFQRVFSDLVKEYSQEER